MSAEALVADLLASGFRLLLSLEHQALGRLAAVRLIPPGESDEGIVVDLLFNSWQLLTSRQVDTGDCSDRRAGAYARSFRRQASGGDLSAERTGTRRHAPARYPAGVAC